MLCAVTAVCSAFALSSFAEAQKDGTLPTESSSEIRAIEATHFTPYQNGSSYQNTIAKGGLKSHEIVHAKSFPTTIANRGSSTDKDVWLRTLASNTDVIVIGRLRHRTSALIDTGDFVFSDYQLQVESVLLDRGRGLNAGQTIVVARAGGFVRQGDWVFRGIDPEFHLFQEGERYLLFLTLLPDSNTFLARASGSFLLKGGKVRSGATHFIHMPEERDEDTLLRQVYQIANQEAVRR